MCMVSAGEVSVKEEVEEGRRERKRETTTSPFMHVAAVFCISPEFLLLNLISSSVVIKISLVTKSECHHMRKT